MCYEFEQRLASETLRKVISIRSVVALVLTVLEAQGLMGIKLERDRVNLRVIIDDALGDLCRDVAARAS